MTLSFWIALGILLPLFGTAAGAAAVFFCKGDFGARKSALLDGAAAGVMTAAAIFSLLLPAIEGAAAWGTLAFLPAAVGLLLGGGLLLLCHASLPAQDGRTAALWAITLHNLPEGLAVGVLFSALAAGEAGVTPGGALAMAAGIALQNVPEGAIVSLPLRAMGASRRRAFLLGTGSGAVEPLAALLTLPLAPFVGALLPWLLGMAAGAMLGAVATELLGGEERGWRGGAFLFGFALMMVPDVALG